MRTPLRLPDRLVCTLLSIAGIFLGAVTPIGSSSHGHAYTAAAASSSPFASPTLGRMQAASAPTCNPAQPSIPQPCGSLSAISALSANDIWAVGTNTNTTPNLVLLEHWNGRRWQVMPSMVPGRLYGVAAVTPTDVWAVGVGGGKTGLAGAMIMHFDGRHWSVVLQHTKTSYLYALAAVSTHDIWAVGLNWEGRALLLHWDGVRWRQVPGPTGPGTDLLGVAAVSSTDLWAVGNLGTIAHWNGKTWRQFPFPPGGNPKGLPTGGGAVYVVLKALAVVSAHDIWAVGSYDAANCCRAGAGPVALHWNGTTWRRIPIPGIPNSVVTDAVGLFLTGVAAVSTRNVWAVSIDGAEHWDGIRWRVGVTPKNAGLVAVAALSARDIWSVGFGGDTGYATIIAHWTGTQWNIVPSPNTNQGGNNR